MQNYFLRLDGEIFVLDIVGKQDAITASLPFHSEQDAIQVSHNAQDLHAFVREVNFAAAWISHKFL
jgi:dihydrodipicolinate reductase